MITLGLIGIAELGICEKNGEVAQKKEKVNAEIEEFLLQNGPELIANGQYQQVLTLIEDLPIESRRQVKIRTIECFANLKGWTTEKDMICKMNFGALRQKIISLRNSAVTPLLVIFLKDEDRWLRKYAAELLGWIGDERALNDLREAASNDEEFGVRKYAKWAYEQISGEKFKKQK